MILFSVKAQEKVPEWLDTIPPKVSIAPLKKVHSEPFSISLKTEVDSKVFISRDGGKKFTPYIKPITITSEGKYRIYYYAEDMFSNRSTIDSSLFILDISKPEINATPKPGIYTRPVTISVSVNKRSFIYFHKDQNGKDTIAVGDKLSVIGKFDGYVTAQDMAGNITRSEKLSYVVDTSAVLIDISPEPGVYSNKFHIKLYSQDKASLFYSFDPNAVTENYSPYRDSISCPYGLSLIHYYAVKPNGKKSPIFEATFVRDTVAPKIRYKFRMGSREDTLELFTKEKSTIRYLLDRDADFKQAIVYKDPVIFQKKGMGYLNAVAVDRAGNISKRFLWERKYDKTNPTITSSHISGLYNKEQVVRLTMSEPGKILYTLNGEDPNESSPIYDIDKGISISKQGITILKFYSIDKAQNISELKEISINIDNRAPKVRARLEGETGDSIFYVRLIPDEKSKVYYSIGENEANIGSPQYTDRISLSAGEILYYFAVDSAGNRSRMYKLDQLQKPMVTADPNGGVYRAYVKTKFKTSMESDVFYRILPDTAFTKFVRPVIFKTEGLHRLEYYCVSFNGMKSTAKQVSYLLDWTVPKVGISLKKGIGDSVSIFFKADENVSIYYTSDGTNPLYSRTAQTAGNRFTNSSARISLLRKEDTKLAFYAEDLAGNQTALNIMDIFKPRPVPNLPFGKDRIYDKILSLELKSYDDRSQIYYERGGKEPDLNSPLYTSPITLLRSDTISAFVIDASGYRGKTERFIYRINMPPTPMFTITPEIGGVGESVLFDASNSIDPETPLSGLIYQWDLNGDGKMDIEKKGNPKVTYRYSAEGLYKVKLKIVDPLEKSGQYTGNALIKGYCPEGMVHIPRENGKSFCIDRYEWPNKSGELPKVNVSWVHAAMFCHDQGKRLCTAEEWEYTCSGGQFDGKSGELRTYPYGNKYKSGKCPSESELLHPSGSFEECGEKFGTRDMIGNAWEWVSDKKESAPLMMGGSHTYGEKARCGYYSVSSLNSGSQQTGFRCCK